MSDHTIASTAPMDGDNLSDDSALHRLFDVTASGQSPQELAQLDALVYGRLTQAYDQNVAIDVLRESVRAA